MSEQAEQYSVEWFRWMAINNPKWLGTQALKLWRHYMVLEAKLEAMERLKTYAMLLESHVGYGYVNEIRHQLGVTDEMINWIIPADHRKLLDAAQEEQE